MMDTEFQPPRQLGLILQVGVVLILAGVGGYFFFLAAQDPSGLDFILHMLIALLVLTPLPLLAYRVYALLTGAYILRRDGLMIRWGLRREDIPLREIEWIRPVGELGFKLPMPWLRWPGAILGFRKAQELGQVEFIASDMDHMLLVATAEKVFAISPSDVNQFSLVFRRINEMGSLTPMDAQSVYPKVLWGQVWEDRLARFLILLSLGVGLVLLGTVAIIVPGLDSIDWITPGTNAPPERLLLLPVLEGILWLVDFIAGLFLYRRSEDMKIAAYLLWGSAGVTSLLLLAACLLLIF